MTHVLFSFANLSTGHSFDAWVYHDEKSNPVSIRYTITNDINGRCVFSDIIDVTTDNYEMKLSKLLTQVGTDFISY